MQVECSALVTDALGRELWGGGRDLRIVLVSRKLKSGGGAKAGMQGKKRKKKLKLWETYSKRRICPEGNASGAPSGQWKENGSTQGPSGAFLF